MRNRPDGGGAPVEALRNLGPAPSGRSPGAGGARDTLVACRALVRAPVQQNIIIG